MENYVSTATLAKTNFDQSHTQGKINYIYYESTSAIGTKKLLIACRFFDNDKYEYERSEVERRREQ